jgi:alpha-L-fucosidase
MNRRAFHRILAGGLASSTLHAVPSKRYEPTWESIRTHTVPDWFADAKLGIFIHWGLYSVPAWAPPTGELGKVDFNKWFYQNPYAEWYLNSLRLKKSATYKHHVETYGANFDYYDFARDFNRDTQKWQPSEWARLFREAGARYAVLTTKHHDGFRLWPSRVPNPKRPGVELSAKRDLVGELTEAVRSQGLKMGLYYSGGLDWTFEPKPIANLADLKSTAPQTEEYARYADAHWRELIDLYQPSVLWNDITYPKAGKLTEIFSDYYNRVPDGLIDNRFGVEFADFTTPEYANYDKITEKKWESCRGLGFSFGYNRVEGPEHVIAPDKLIALLVDIVSKNGNLLLNIGPRPDGSISELQTDRLRELGRWLGANGEGIYGTRPWVRPSAKTPEGSGIRFTAKGDSLYAFALNRPRGATITLPSLRAAQGSSVVLLGSGTDLQWSQKSGDLIIRTGTLPAEYVWGFKITPPPQSI